MTGRLDLVIAKLQDLPDAEQDRLAETIVGLIGGLEEGPKLSAEQVAEVRSRLQHLREGSHHLASDDEMSLLWTHCGL